MATERDPRGPAGRKARPASPGHRHLEDRLGRVWAWIFVGVVLVLAVVLVGKAFLAKGG